MKLIKPLSLCASGLMLTTYVLATGMSQSNIQNIQSNAAANNDTVTLGTAYNSEKEGFYALHSVSGLIDETYGNTEMDFVVGVDMSYSQLSNMLDGNLGAALDLPVIKVGVGASHAKENAADNYTGTYTLYLSMKPKKKKLVPESGKGFQPTPAALELVEAYPGDKFNRVGNEFVSVIEYGAQVMVNLKFEYKNQEDKVKWGGQLDVDWIGIVDVSGQLEKVDNETKRNIKITVSATQMGGDPNRLLSVIPNELIECTMESPKPCFDIFANTINYMKTDFIHQFNTLDKYNVTQVQTSGYLDSGPFLSPLIPENDYPSKSILTKLATKNLSEQWVQAIMDNRRADNLINYYGSELSSEHRSALESIRDDALFNSFMLADAVSYCQRNPIGEYCRDRELSINSTINKYDRAWLEL